MHVGFVLRHPALPLENAGPGRSLAAWARFGWNRSVICARRYAERDALRRLDRQGCQDLGAGRVAEEAAKPFWQP